MRYLRMFSNSMAAAMLATSYVLVLVLQLNPALPLDPARLAPLATAIGLFYTIHLTAIFYVVLVIVQLLSRELFSPAWLSVSVLAWLAAASSGAAAVLTWANVNNFGVVLEPRTIERMTTAAVLMACASALFVIVGIARRYAGPARTVLGVSLLTVAFGSVAGSVALRGRATLPPLESHPLTVALGSESESSERPSSRVIVLAIDAGSLELVAAAAAEGRLPNFGRIFDRGAVMHLATLHPTSAEAVWAAVATGKLPQKNGVRAGVIYRVVNGHEAVQLLPGFCFASNLMRFGFLLEEPLSSAAIRTRTLWSLLATQGISVGVVNWPLTYPASVVRGYLVSDAYTRLALTPSGLDDAAMMYPADLRAEAFDAFQAAAADAAPVLPPAIEAELDERQRQPSRTDRTNDRLARSLDEEYVPQVSILRYQSLDPIGHYFLRDAMPSAFGDVSDDEQRRLGAVLESHYALVDEAIGRAIAHLGPDDLLLVISGYGMEPLGLGKRIWERLVGDPDISGTHDDAPDGFLLAYGAPVARARSLRRASVVDVVPTILYFLGLPIGRDMDGYARTDIFQSTFTEERPLTFIPTYDR